MPERARSLSEVFFSENFRDSAIRLGISAGALAAVETVSAKTNGSFREMAALALVFGIPVFLNFVSYAGFDQQEETNISSVTKDWIRTAEDNIFESPRR